MAYYIEGLPMNNNACETIVALIRRLLYSSVVNYKIINYKKL